MLHLSPESSISDFDKVPCSDNEKIAEITCVINQEMEARISVAIEAVAADLRYCSSVCSML